MTPTQHAVAGILSDLDLDVTESDVADLTDRHMQEIARKVELADAVEGLMPEEGYYFNVTWNGVDDCTVAVTDWGDDSYREATAPTLLEALRAADTSGAERSEA